MSPQETSRALAEFLKWAMEDGPFNGCDLDGGSVQDKAEELGLLKIEPYDEAKHGESEFDIDPGDDWYVLSDDVKELLK